MFVSHRQAATMLGVATFAGVIVLPWPMLLALVAITYAAAWPPFRRAGAKAHRHAYTAGSVAAASLAASAVLDRLPTLPGVPLAICVYIAINAALVMLAITVAGHREAWQMFRRRNFYTVLVSTLGLGAAVGLAMQWHLSAGLAGVPVLVGLHLRSRDATVEDAGVLDDGVWDRDAWLVLADEQARTGDCYSVVLFDMETTTDLDMALALAREGFACGVIGRYSASQIVVLLPGLVVSAANVLGVRLGLALAERDVVAGVGAADSLRRSLSDVLLLAECEAVICRSATEDDDVPGLV